mgnify:CR=1 FL=1
MSYPIYQDHVKVKSNLRWHLTLLTFLTLSLFFHSYDQVLGELTAPVVSCEVQPVSCPIYQDPDSGPFTLTRTSLYSLSSLFHCYFHSYHQVLGEFTAPTVSYEVKPVSCPIYQDPDSGRNYVSFEDCSASTLTIKVTPRESVIGCYTEHRPSWTINP